MVKSLGSFLLTLSRSYTGAQCGGCWRSSTELFLFPLPLWFGRMCCSFSVGDSLDNAVKWMPWYAETHLRKSFLCNINRAPLIQIVYLLLPSCHSAFFPDDFWASQSVVWGPASWTWSEPFPSPALEHRAVSWMASHIGFSRRLVLAVGPSAVLTDVNLPLSVHLCQELKLWTYILNIGGC